MSPSFSLSTFFSLRRGVATPGVLARFWAAGLGGWGWRCSFSRFAGLSVVVPDFLADEVFERPRVCGEGAFGGARCDIDRSMEGDAAEGGVGAGL